MKPEDFRREYRGIWESPMPPCYTRLESIQQYYDRHPGKGNTHCMLQGVAHANIAVVLAISSQHAETLTAAFQNMHGGATSETGSGFTVRRPGGRRTTFATLSNFSQNRGAFLGLPGGVLAVDNGAVSLIFNEATTAIHSLVAQVQSLLDQLKVAKADIASLQSRIQSLTFDRNQFLDQRDELARKVKPFLLGQELVTHTLMFHDLDPDVVVYQNYGEGITASDFRDLHATVLPFMRRFEEQRRAMEEKALPET